MPIEIEMEGICKGCDMAELKLKSVVVEQFDCTVKKHWSIRCKHEPVCKRWQKNKVSTQ